MEESNRGCIPSGDRDVHSVGLGGFCSNLFLFFFSFFLLLFTYFLHALILKISHHTFIIHELTIIKIDPESDLVKVSVQHIKKDSHP